MSRPESTTSPAALPLSSLLASLVEDSIDSVRVAPLDDPCRSIYINRTGLAMFGVTSVDEFNERDPVDFFGEEGVRLIVEESARAAREGRTWSGQDIVRNVRTGERTFVLAHTYPVSDPESGMPVAIAVIDRDITELESIRTARSRLSAIVEHSGDLIAYAPLDDPMRLTYINPAGLDMLGVADVDEFNELGAEAFLGANELRRTLDEIVPRVMRGEPWVEEAELRNARTGETVPVHRQIFPINDPVTGIPVARGVIVRDIRDLKEAEEYVRDIGALNERNRIAREIHDSLAQSLAEIRWLLEALQAGIRSGRKSAAGTADTVNRLKELTRRALREARRSVWDLGPSELETRSLEDALRLSVTRITREAGIEGDFGSSGDTSALSRELKAAVLRVCQEALHNIRKHARARHANVTLRVGEGMVELVVEDDGRGFNVADAVSGGGYGLTSMQGRASAVGGEFQIDRGSNGAGTRVRLRVPLDGGKSR